MTRGVLVVCAAAALSGCSTFLAVDRQQAPIFTVQGERPGIGLLDVAVDDEVLARAPNDFSNLTGLISKVLRDYVDERGGFVGVDYTMLGFKPHWERSYDARENAAPVKVKQLDGVPAGVQTQLVTVVKVLDWSTTTEVFNKQTKDVAHVRLVMSTWTREGREVLTEVCDALWRSGESTLFLKAGDRRLAEWFQKSDGHGPFMRTTERRADLFMSSLREAVGVHLYPYFPHKVHENLVMMDDEPLKPALQAALRGAYDEALAGWTELYQKDPQNHGAMYDAAMMLLVKGDEAGAYLLLKKAYALKDKWIYGAMMDTIGARLAMRKSISAAGVSVPGMPSPGS